MKNVIILGAGRTGSSFLAGLISHRRFYIEKDSISSRDSYPDGDYENPDLKALNKKILKLSGYDHPKIDKSETASIEKIKSITVDSKNNVYKEFIARCEMNKPWLWKDPRLCYTIHFLDRFLDKNNINFIKITRDPYLVFRSHSKHHISYSLKSVIQTYHLENVAVDDYLSEKEIRFLNVDYSELKNENIIYKLNDFLGTSITTDDYNHIRKEGINRKESYYKFQTRYALGLLRNTIQNIFRK